MYPGILVLTLVSMAEFVSATTTELTWMTTEYETVTEVYGCGDINHYGTYGFVNSPNYPEQYYNSLSCVYSIIASSGSSFGLIFKAFDVDDNVDNLMIHCLTNGSFPNTYYKGHYIPEPIAIPWCDHAHFHFYTDSSITYTGFSIEYYVSNGGCGNTIFNGTSGVVTSPNYPSSYGNNQNCSNIIWARQRSDFYISFSAFSVPSCGSCSCDWVEIRCEDNPSFNPRRFCGSFPSSFYVYDCTKVLVWFRSDGSAVYSGFRLNYYIYTLPVTAVTDDSTIVSDTMTTPVTTVTEEYTTYQPPEECTTSTSVYWSSDLHSEPKDAGRAQSLIIRRGSPRCIVVCRPQCTASLGECYSAPCMNNGTCVEQPGGYQCLCDTYYTGVNCDEGA